MTGDLPGKKPPVPSKLYLHARIVRIRTTFKPLPAERKTVKLDSKIIAAYIGECELNPRFVIAFFRDGEKFMTQLILTQGSRMMPAKKIK